MACSGCSGNCGCKTITKDDVMNYIKTLSEEDRKDFLFETIFDEYCRYCGDEMNGQQCQCWNDE